MKSVDIDYDEPPVMVLDDGRATNGEWCDRVAWFEPFPFTTHIGKCTMWVWLVGGDAGSISVDFGMAVVKGGSVDIHIRETTS